MADEDVQVTFGASVDELKSGIASAKDSVDSIRESLTHLAEIFGVAFSIEGVKGFIESMAALGISTERTGVLLGQSNQQVIELSGFAKLTGTDIDTLANGIAKMSLNIQKSTKDGFNPAAQALRQLGISASNLIGLPADEWIKKLGEASAKFNPSLNLTNGLMQIGGRGAAQLIASLRAAGISYEEFKRLVDQATEGLAASIPGMANTHEKLTLLGISVQSLGARIFSALKPAIDSVVVSLTNWVQSIKTEDIRNAISTIGSVTISVLQSVSTFFVEAGAQFETFAAKLGSFDLKRTALNVLDPNFGDMFLGKDNSLDKTLAGIETTAKTRLEAIGQLAQQYRASLSSAIYGGGGGPSGGAPAPSSPAGGGQDFGATNEGAANAAKAAAEQYQEMITQAKGAYAVLKAQYSTDAAVHKITVDQESAQLMAALDQRWAIEQALFNRELALYPEGSVQYNAILKQMQAAYQAYAKEHQGITDTMLKADVAQWQSVLSPIESAWNSQLRGLLDGTTTWSAAMKKIVGDLVIAVIEYFEKIAVEKAALGLTNMFGAGPQSLLGGLLGGGGSQAAGGAALQAGATTLTTGATTLQVAATTLQGAATALAAGSVAAPLNILPAVAAFDTGSWSVPRNMFAMVHEGEMIVPKIGGMADALRGAFSFPQFDAGTDFVASAGLAMLHRNEAVVPAAARGSGPFTGRGMGGDTHHHYAFNISTPNSRDMARALMDNDSAVMKAVRSAIKRGAHLQDRSRYGWG